MDYVQRMRDLREDHDKTQQEIADLYGHCKSTAWHYIHSALQMLQKEMEGFSHGEY